MQNVTMSFDFDNFVRGREREGEAPSCSRWEGWKHEAELRLKGAETNLERLDDIMITLDAQMQSLRKQVRQATRYRNLNLTNLISVLNITKDEDTQLYYHFINRVLDCFSVKHKETSDELFATLQGSTDSELCFALFLNNLPDGHQAHYGHAALQKAMQKTLKQLRDWARA